MCEEVPLEEIDSKDGRFRLSFPVSDRLLSSSIEQVGILKPLILLRGRPFLVISGFKRLYAAERLGLRSVPSMIVDVDEKRAILIAIHENIRRGLNAVEKAHALQMMVRAGFDWSAISQVMRLLSIDPRDRFLQLFLNVSHAEEEVKTFIASRNMMRRNMEALLSFEAEERLQIVRMLSKMRLTEASLLEILTMLMLAKTKLGHIPFSRLSGSVEVGELRAELKRMTQPELCRLEASLRERMARLSLSAGAKVLSDSFFERDYIEISFRIKSPDDLERAIEDLRKNKATIEEILEIATALR